MKNNEKIGKPFDINHAYKIVKSMNKNKIFSQACFVLGYPGEDKDDLKSTKDMILNLTKNGIDEITLFIITPIPGSEIFNVIRGYNNFSELNFSPNWRQDYSYLFKKRLEFYSLFLLFKFFYYPLKKFLNKYLIFLLADFKQKWKWCLINI